MITTLKTTHIVEMNPRELDVIYMALELLRDDRETFRELQHEVLAIMSVLTGAIS